MSQEQKQIQQIGQIIDPSLPKRFLLLSLPYASLDFEFAKFKKTDLENIDPIFLPSVKDSLGNITERNVIFAASFVDNQGNAQTRHISDFVQSMPKYPELGLIQWINYQLLQYPTTFGWYSKGVRRQEMDEETGAWYYKGKDSDLKILDLACQHYNQPSVIKLTKRGTPYVKGYTDSAYKHLNQFYKYCHIDLHEIYKKQIIKFACKSACPNLRLDTVTRALLTPPEGKYQNLTGKDAHKLPLDILRPYVEQDARLVIKLVQNNNYKILDLMQMIANIAHFDFQHACATNIATWMGSVLDNLGAIPNKIKKKKYTGGHVFDPVIGHYENQSIYVLDVKSLYPTMIINHNLSPETVCCECCKNDASAYVSDKIMDLVNSEVEEKREPYWICKKPGLVSDWLKVCRAERFKYSDETTENKALKIILNGTYGLFANKLFKYSNYRVSELTTAFGRNTLYSMKELATSPRYNFEVIYGDTDSIFLLNVQSEQQLSSLLDEWERTVKDVEIGRDYKVGIKLLLKGKKHYILVIRVKQKDGSYKRIVLSKGMEGRKSDRPPLFKEIQKQFELDYANDVNLTSNLRKFYMRLEQRQVNLDELSITMQLSKNPQDYSTNIAQKLIGQQLEALEGDVISFYKADCLGKATIEVDKISYSKYIEMFTKTFEPLVTLAGHDFERDVLGVISIADI